MLLCDWFILRNAYYRKNRLLRRSPFDLWCPRYDTEPHNPQIYRSVYNGYQDMLDYNLDSDDEMETVSVMVVDEAGNLVPVTTESEASVQAEFVSCDEREVSQLVRLVEGGGNS